MQTVEGLKLLPVWVDPQHIAATAKHIMAGHGLKVLGVVSNGKLLGTVSYAALAQAPDDRRVVEYLDPMVRTVPADMRARELADLFVAEDLEFAAAVKGERFLGIVFPNHLLKELQRSYDPLTRLPWSDHLRHWGAHELQSGREITILFLDIDDFGQYNKKYGHVVGDRVLRNVAAALVDSTDPERDVVVRYGGDEFAIGTLRHLPDAQALSEIVQKRLDAAFVDETYPSVTFCMGLQGGKRTHERENVHYAATLDNLINLASRDCMSKKRSLPEPPPPPVRAVVSSPVEGMAAFVSDESKEPAARVVSVYADEHSPTSLTTVILSTGASVVSGVHQRQGSPLLESVAHAAAKALERVDAKRSFTLDEVLLGGNGSDEKVVTVTGHLRIDGEERPVAGVATVQGDLYAAVAEALIRAFDN